MPKTKEELKTAIKSWWVDMNGGDLRAGRQLISMDVEEAFYAGHELAQTEINHWKELARQIYRQCEYAGSDLKFFLEGDETLKLFDELEEYYKEKV